MNPFPPNRFLRLLPVLAGLSLTGCNPDDKYRRDINKLQTVTSYTRADAPDIRIPIKTSSTNGFTASEIDAIQSALNVLPAQHLRYISAIAGYAAKLPTSADGRGMASGIAIENEGIILFRTPRDPNAIDLRHSVFHEAGHLVAHRMLTEVQKEEWIAFHRDSKAGGDFISSYAESNQKEDFAETYASWIRDTDDMAWNAVESVVHTKSGFRLQKYLFMAAVFADQNGMMSSYSPNRAVQEEEEESDIPFFLRRPPSLKPGEDVVKVSRQRISISLNSLRIGHYIYRLDGRKIIAIYDETGHLIEDRLAIDVPDIVFRRLPLSGVADNFYSPARGDQLDESVNAAVSETLPRWLAPKHSVLSNPMQVISLNDPTHRIALMSDEGYAARAADQAMLRDPNHVPTVEDMIRSHGSFVPVDYQQPQGK